MVVKDPKTGHSEWLVEDVRWVFKNDGKEDFGAAIIILDRYPHATRQNTLGR